MFSFPKVGRAGVLDAADLRVLVKNIIMINIYN